MAAELPGALGVVREDPAHSAVFLDFDGTLAAIVDDPAQAAPWPGVPDLLARLGRVVGQVAVVSGRPAAFLSESLGPPAGVELFGLYGMERVGSDGVVAVAPAAGAWREVVERLGRRAVVEAPPGARIEPKGLTLTLHWRTAPASEPWAERFARAAAEREGLVAQHGRMSVELRPPVDTDKGTVVRRLGQGWRAAVYLGDDLGDLKAFEALGELAAAGVAVAAVAVTDHESPLEVRQAADLCVEGPAGAVALLEGLLGG